MSIKFLSASVQNVIACKYIVAMGIKVISASVQNVIACKYIAPMGIKVILASVQNVLACKLHPRPMGIDIVSVVVKSGDKSLRINTTYKYYDLNNC